MWWAGTVRGTCSEEPEQPCEGGDSRVSSHPQPLGLISGAASYVVSYSFPSGEMGEWSLPSYSWAGMAFRRRLAAEEPSEKVQKTRFQIGSVGKIQWRWVLGGGREERGQSSWPWTLDLRGLQRTKLAEFRELIDLDESCVTIAELELRRSILALPHYLQSEADGLWREVYVFSRLRHTFSGSVC